MKAYHIGSSFGGHIDQLVAVEMVKAAGGIFIRQSPVMHGGFYVRAPEGIAAELELTEVPDNHPYLS